MRIQQKVESPKHQYPFSEGNNRKRRTAPPQIPKRKKKCFQTPKDGGWCLVVSAGPPVLGRWIAHFSLWLDRWAVSQEGRGIPLGKWVDWVKGRPPALTPCSFLSAVHSCTL